MIFPYGALYKLQMVSTLRTIGSMHSKYLFCVQHFLYYFVAKYPI